MKRLSYKKNNKIINKRLSKINGGRPPIEDNQCNIVATLAGHTLDVSPVAFHSRLPLMATGSYDKTVKVWDFRTWRPLSVAEDLLVRPPTNQLLAVAWSEGG